MNALTRFYFVVNGRAKAVHFCSARWKSSPAHLPEITIPIPLKAKIKKVLRKRAQKLREKQLTISQGGNRFIPIITSKRGELTHNKGQVYDKFKPLPLCSKGWYHHKSKGDYFIIHGFDSNPACNEESTSQDDKRGDFNSFDLDCNILSTLDSLGINNPTNIQALTIPQVLNVKNVICAAETGSGKTLAYLAPIISNILQYKSTETDLKDNSPLGIILAPGRELVEQIGNVARQLTRDIPFKTKTIVGGGAQSHMMYNPPIHRVDLMVATLATLKKLVYTKVYNTKSVRHLVIDEADTMLDDSFIESLISFMERFKFRQNFLSPDQESENCVQLCLVGATLPRDLIRTLNAVIDVETMEKITTQHLHRIMPHVPQKFLRVSSSEKPSILLTLVKTDLKKKKPVMIFCKNRSTSDYVNMFLQENGVDNINLDGQMMAKFRRGRFEKFQSGQVNVITCTDVASRGLDTIRVQHVINYDFPSFISDYIHRAGRTGRVGSKVTGHVTNFISQGYEVELVQKIETSVRLTQSLPNVNANIKRKLFDADGESPEGEYM